MRVLRPLKFCQPPAVALIGVFLFTGCGRPSQPPVHPDVIATVDGTPILRSDLERELARTADKRGGSVQNVLDDLIQRERFVARARRLGLHQDPDVQHSIQNVLIAKLKERELEPKFTTPDLDPDEPRNVARAGQGARPVTQARLAVLRIEVSPRSSSSKVQQATLRLQEARMKALRLPENQPGFGPLALEYSDDDATRFRGGDLGWFDPDPARYNLEPALLAAGFALEQVGEISPVIQGRDALYLVRLMGRRQAQQSLRSEAAERHRRYLEQRKSAEAAFIEETRRMIPVTIYPSALSAFCLEPAEATDTHLTISEPRNPTADFMAERRPPTVGPR